MDEEVITVKVKSELENINIYGCVAIQTKSQNTLDWLIDEFCRITKVDRERHHFVLRNSKINHFDLNQTIEHYAFIDGDVVHLHNAELSPMVEEERESFLFRRIHVWGSLAVVLIFIGVGAILTLVLLHVRIHQEINSDRELYGIVIDCGSTSTKVFVYQWRNPLLDASANISQLSYTQTTIALDKPGGIAQMFNAVLRSAKKYIPDNILKKSQVFLGATAGMRLLQVSNSSLVERIFLKVRNILQKTGLMFHKPHTQARIINGTEEGVNSWITINYLSNVFSSKSNHSTIGSLDLGGASTQISYEITPHLSRKAPSKTTINISLYKKMYHVYSGSFSCYGKSQAQSRFLALLIKKSNFNQIVQNPCAARGTVVLKTGTHIFNNPCTNGTMVNTSLMIHILNFTFLGTSQSDKCQLLVNELFHKSSCTTSSCKFNNVNQPKLSRGRFFAFSGFYYTMRFFNLTANSKLNKTQSSLGQAHHAVKMFCQLSWDEIKDIPVFAKRFLITSCFDGYFILRLLSLYGFNTEIAWSQITFLNQVSKKTIAWSLGYMIAIHSRNSQDGKKNFKSSINGKAFLVIFLLFSFVLGLSLFCIVILIRYFLKRRTSLLHDDQVVRIPGDDALYEAL